jgi:acetolactate synthase-1/2/3 large subunit
MMKLSDYVFKYLSDYGVKDVFYLPGGGAMHLDDSLAHTPGINAVCMLHEQAASIAAEAYARIKNTLSVCCVTSGPGGTNALTGLAGAYLDATPVLFISGQAKRADLVGDQRIRQFGIQEINIIDMVRPVTKYAVSIQDPQMIRYELEKAIFYAFEGKPGPVWIEIPVDVSAAQIDEKTLQGFEKPERNYECADKSISETIELLNQAKRPLLILGHGIRIGNAIPEMNRLIEKLRIPVLTTWNGVDLIEDSNPYFFGRPGASGMRHANIIQQNADLVITLGTRLCLLSTGYDYDSFLKNAKHIMVEIDPNEMNKKSVHPYLKICADVKSFLEKMLLRYDEIHLKDMSGWLSFCNRMKEKYPLLIKEQAPETDDINTYEFVDELSRQMSGNDIFQFTSSGISADICMETFRIKKGQRAFLTKGLASMGFDLPASIGSCIASNGKRTVCLTGDGGFMMNIQELATLKRLDLNVKIFVLNNKGYAMIYNSQKSNFKRLSGADKDSGLELPDIAAVSESFGIHSEKISNVSEMKEKISEVLAYDGPVICCVDGYIGQQILPRQVNYKKDNGQMASRPLEDMAPLLDREELAEDMIFEGED